MADKRGLSSVGRRQRTQHAPLLGRKHGLSSPRTNNNLSSVVNASAAKDVDVAHVSVACPPATTQLAAPGATCAAAIREVHQSDATVEAVDLALRSYFK